MDINCVREEGNLTQEVLEKLIENGPSFLIVKFPGADRGYDEFSYYRLGKCGKKTVPAENIRALFSVEESDMNLEG